MRIIGGTLGGRRLRVPNAPGLRPTTDRVREALASILDSRALLHEARVLELFAGTGATSFELLSRGASRAVAIDVQSKLVKAMGSAARELGLDERFDARRLDLFADPERLAERLRDLGPFDLVLADPPYADVDYVPPLLTSLAAAGALAVDAVAVLEHSSRRPPRSWGAIAKIGEYRYGDTAVVLTALPEAREPAP